MLLFSHMLLNENEKQQNYISVYPLQNIIASDKKTNKSELVAYAFVCNVIFSLHFILIFCYAFDDIDTFVYFLLNNKLFSDFREWNC